MSQIMPFFGSVGIDSPHTIAAHVCAYRTLKTLADSQTATVRTDTL